MKVTSIKLSPANLVLLGIFLLAAILFSVGYDFGLPILTVDEGWLLGYTLEQRGLTDVDDIPGYPPVIMTVLSAATIIVEITRGNDLLNRTGEIIALVRLVNVIVNLGTLLVTYRLVKRLSNTPSALFAAFIWAISQGIFEHTRLALSESWLLFFVTGSLFFMVETLEQKRARFALASTVLGLLAVAAKYNIFFVLSFGIFPVLLFIWQGNRTWWEILIMQLLLIAGTAYFLLVIYRGLAGRETASFFLTNGAEQITSLQLIARVFNTAFALLNLRLIYAAPLLILGSIVYLRKASWTYRLVWGLLLFFATSTTWLVASYLFHFAITDRYVAAASSVWLVLLVISVTSIFSLFPRKPLGYLCQILFALLIVVLWLLPMVNARWLSFDTFMRKDTRVGLADWTNASLPEGTIALDGQHWFIFDPLWGGYHGTLRPFVARENWLDRPLQDWTDAHILYVQVNGAYPGDTSILSFSDVYHLKSFPIPGQEAQWTGDVFHIYRLVSENFVEVNLAFENGISLAAYELSDQNFVAGETIEFLPYWRAAQGPAFDYQVFLHLVPLDRLEPLSQIDLSPALRPSSSWNDSYETVLGNVFQLTIPDQLEAGNYRLILGLYRLDTFERLRTVEGLDYFEIAEIHVQN